jgi:serine/threonine protein kinase
MDLVPPALADALRDRYCFERELGRGGMATVYLAEDPKHRRKVAIKVLRPELAAVIGAGRFVREIQTIAALQHPHILGLIDSGEVNGTAYYVMPFVEGESLRDRLTREKQLPIPDAVRIATEVSSALDYAHRRSHPPRHQAREHSTPRGPGTGHGLRHRAGRELGRRHANDRDRHEPRHAALHVT